MPCSDIIPLALPGESERTFELTRHDQPENKAANVRQVRHSARLHLPLLRH
jgi:hypothetical protein